MALVIFLSCLIGAILGCVITQVILTRRRKPVGILKVNYLDEDGPYLYLELDTNPDNILSKELVTFRVDSRARH